MSPSFRACPDCGDDRRFEQYHGVPGTCPDSPDGECPEWACTECGTAVLTGPVSGLTGQATARDVSARVA